MNNSDKNIRENMSESSPFFTIIIPAYNAKDSITKAINSVISQSFKDYEILIIDDCSTDNTFKICKALKKKISNIRIIRNDKNSGVSASRNIAINNSKGNWILFLDSDDYFNDNDFFELLSKKCINCDMVLFGYSILDLDEGGVINTWSINSKTIKKDYANFDIFENQTPKIVHWFPIWCRCYRNEFLLNNNLAFDESLNASEDNLWFFDCLLALPRVNYLDKLCYCYNKKKKPSLSKMGNKEKYSIAAFDICIENVKKADIQSKYKQIIYKFLYKWLLTLLIDIKSYYSKQDSKKYLKLLLNAKFLLNYSYDNNSKICSWIIKIFGINLGSSFIHKVYNLLK